MVTIVTIVTMVTVVLSLEIFSPTADALIGYFEVT